MENYKRGSDVEIAIYVSSITAETVNRLSVILNENLPIPYYFDIVHYDSLEHEGLKKHIEDFFLPFLQKIQRNKSLYLHFYERKNVNNGHVCLEHKK